MASDRPEQNDAEQDEENREQNDLEEIADLKIQGNTFLIDGPACMFLKVLRFHSHLMTQNNWNIFQL